MKENMADIIRAMRKDMAADIMASEDRIINMLRVDMASSIRKSEISLARMMEEDLANNIMMSEMCIKNAVREDWADDSIKCVSDDINRMKVENEVSSRLKICLGEGEPGAGCRR